MDDNLSLSEKVKLRYKGRYTGVFYKRFILGLWVVADGVCFEQFANEPDKWLKDKAEEQINFISVGVDFGVLLQKQPLLQQPYMVTLSV